VKSSFFYPITISTIASFAVGLFLPVELSLNLANFPINNNNELVENLSPFPEISSGIVQNFEVILEKWEQEDQKKKLQKQGLIPDQYQGKIIQKIPLKPEKKIVALTFDDGPWPDYTNHILYVLEKYNIKATFFILGRNAQLYPGRLQQIALHGHALGNHSWSHPYRYQNPHQAAQEIEKTNRLIEQLTGIKTSLFRPPGGFLNNGLVSYAQQQDFAIIMWSGDSRDYRSNKQGILNNLLKQTQSGGILLLHDGGGDRWHTLVALPYLISELKNQGYQFVTVPELLTLNSVD
jgi:peptidoglycan-N-acetylglucosamine deacetylase